MQTGLTVRQALIFIHRQTHRHSAVGVWPYTVELNTSLASFGCLSTHTHTHSLPVCFKHQWRTHPTCSSSSLTNLNVVCSPVGPQSFCEELCVCVVCFWVCVCVIRNVAWSPLVCAFGSVCQRAAAEAENDRKAGPFLLLLASDYISLAWH